MISQRDISMLLIGPRLFFLQNCSQCLD
jgi:hypothetical protein